MIRKLQKCAITSEQRTTGSETLRDATLQSGISLPVNPVRDEEWFHRRDLVGTPSAAPLLVRAVEIVLVLAVCVGVRIDDGALDR